MGKRGPEKRKDGREKWGMAPTVRPETRAFFLALCERERLPVSAFMGKLLEDEHARRLLGEIEP